METKENMKFWDSVKKTDPKRVKAITGKQYKGNSPQPYYLVERMTESFGMCGIGWGINIINERMERLTDTDVLHVAVVELWYKQGDAVGKITQIGQTKACYKTSSGGMLVDEDAPKKSVTDAMTKCMSYLGFAGDIFSGQWDDSKYVQELNNEFSQKPVQNNFSAELRDVALQGTEALTAYHNNNKHKPGYREVWEKEGKAIKAAALLADKPITQQDQKEAA
jgi:hypothetical protein